MSERAKADSPSTVLPLRERNRLRTRREMLDAALEVFTESGYGSATVESIAARVGASKVTLYSYFPQGREELFRELYEEINTQLVEQAVRIHEVEGEFRSRVRALTEALMEVAQRPLVGRFYSIDDPALDEALDPVRGHASGVFADYITADLAAAQKTKSVSTKASPRVVATLLVGAMRSALRDVADGSVSPTEILDSMDALVANL
ncbi:DNA-binding transcriptional regulator, AcrR family [Actinokineospora alba]|uniref:DNA-binding transcriptional regulator, AcrR family n=1 Tax=Actinokineospora alba TaxID=504798 RepID=A0A1H0L622_9PSEU|nr:TetR/AcrR family transcriptional regulator [Actinokineospora alba]TDP67215.1 TetR family transcriptional regulator [Actinokineospora alba]SDJ04209.1 DNA-binding transcriptional regulator, AcrR family [Actinokineospora alba]SDO63678.1 DNA-binding transcriptional regulator, AcrR family [Actinokineospora alba]